MVDGEDSKDPDSKDELSELDNELTEAKKVVEEAVEADRQLSSNVWICTSTHAISKVSFIHLLWYIFD